MTPFNYQQDNLWVENIPVAEIVKAVGTPCYIYSLSLINALWLSFEKAFKNLPHKTCYAVKANSNLAILNAYAKSGAGFDIVSGGELARVIKAGGSSSEVVYSGVGKTAEEMKQALIAKIFCFNVESEDELLLLNEVARDLHCHAPIAIRINPDVDPLSHPYISTGLKENKFGIPIEDAPRLYLLAQKLSNITIKGVACHIGSQITSLSPFVDAYKRLLALTQTLRSQGLILTHIDIGGGLGVPYQNETPPSFEDYAQALISLTPPDLMLILEPGRALIANAGILVTQVLFIKPSQNKNFCIVDCAMNDLLRPALYNAWHNIIPLTKQNGQMRTYDVVGPVCESGDFLGKERSLAVRPNDYLAICSVGAYGFVNSSNYTSRPRSCEVLVQNTEYKVVRERETIEQLFSQEKIW